MFYAMLREARFQAFAKRNPYTERRRGNSMNHLGMKWYTVIKFLLPIGAVINLLYPSMSVADIASQNGLTFSDMVNYAPLYFSIYIGGGIVLSIIEIFLSYNLWMQAPLAASLIRLLVAFNLFSNAILFIYEHSVFGLYNYPLISNTIAICLIWIPTYYYVKKRVLPAWVTESADSQRQAPLYSNKTTDTMQAKAEDQILKQTKKNTSGSLSLREIIPVKLMYVTDQSERDRIVAEMCRGHTDPYTGSLITCEMDWNKYLHAYKTEEYNVMKQRGYAVEPPPPLNDYSMPKQTSEQKPEADNPSSLESPIVEESSTDSSTESKPKYCRICGKPLREDSAFCEYCGTSTK